MNNRFIRINGQEFSFDEVAKALGLGVNSNIVPIKFELCQRVNGGILVAKGADFDYEDYPGIDIEYHLPKEKDSLPIMISRTEKPQFDDAEHTLRTFCYSREDEYFMYFDSDERPDKEVDERPISPSVVLSGSPNFSVDVTTENPYINYRGATEKPRDNSALTTKIQDAASRKDISQSPETMICHVCFCRQDGNNDDRVISVDLALIPEDYAKNKDQFLLNADERIQAYDKLAKIVGDDQVSNYIIVSAAMVNPLTPSQGRSSESMDHSR